jgi:hypothetical protein
VRIVGDNLLKNEVPNFIADWKEGRRKSVGKSSFINLTGECLTAAFSLTSVFEVLSKC